MATGKVAILSVVVPLGSKSTLSSKPTQNKERTTKIVAITPQAGTTLLIGYSVAFPNRG